MSVRHGVLCNGLPGWIGRRVVAGGATAIGLLAVALAGEPVLVARAPDRPWFRMKTTVLGDLPALPEDGPTNRFGGWEPAVESGTGFFRTAKRDGRWWLIDPTGCRFIHRGVASVRQVTTPGAREALAGRFGGSAPWAGATVELLAGHGFNGTGAWSDDEALAGGGRRLVHTRLWSFMAAYGKKRGGTFQKPGHTGYPGDCPFWFDPAFEAFCDEHAKQIAACKDDPWLLGHFTDNELPWDARLLDRHLALPAEDPGHQAARRWLDARQTASGSKPGSLSDRDREAFLEHAADRYFSVVSAAIRRHDPNHLVLGARFHGRALKLPAVFRAAGRHVDVVSVNYYHAWSPDAAALEQWSSQSGRPVMITEWYAKAKDSGLPNRGGAGWLVRTQQDRGAFYQNFTLGLLESKACVGWHWFKYADNDPDDKRADPSNRDSNKGIVSNRYVPYDPLLDAMGQLNRRTFGLIQHLDGNSGGSAKR